MEPIRRYHLDPQGEPVSDLVAFAKEDKREWLSSGRSIDYANTIYLTKSHVLYSDRSRPMFTLLEDKVKRHDFLLTPCRLETFNVFMNVLVAQDGELTIGPPTSKAGEYLELRAKMDLIVGVTTCSAEMSNNHSFKPIDVEVYAG